jgi:hypothetical protein
MAVELDMHRLGGDLDPTDSTASVLERRSRERTYLVLFVQERTWATLSGKQSMLPEVSPGWVIATYSDRRSAV